MKQKKGKLNKIDSFDMFEDIPEDHTEDKIQNIP
jgi:hypothetical protein